MSSDNKSSPDKVSVDEEAPKQLDLTNNVQARIQNPLLGIPRAKLLQQVETFVADKGLQDKTELFKKAALLAQNPKKFEDLDDLTEEDKAIIRRETTRQSLPLPLTLTDIKNLVDKWSQPRDLYLTTVICSLAAAVQ